MRNVIIINVVNYSDQKLLQIISNHNLREIDKENTFTDVACQEDLKNIN